MSAGRQGNICWQVGACLLAGGGVCWWVGVSVGGWGCLLVGGGVCWWVGVSVGGWGRVPHHSEDCTISQQQWGTSIVTKLVLLN